MDRINWVTSRCFHAIAQLARLQGSESVSPELVHARMKAFVDELSQRAREAGYDEHDTKLTAYALTALADEVMMAGAGPMREYWATRPLQLILFGENVAGERFFEHLESARHSPTQTDVLRTYYVCLMLGFRGKYGVRGAEIALTDLTDSVRAQLGRALVMPDSLSPNGTRPEDGLVEVARNLPLLAVAAAALAVACVLYMGLRLSLEQQLEQFLSWMSAAAVA